MVHEFHTLKKISSSGVRDPRAGRNFQNNRQKKKKMARTNKLLTAPINGSVGRRKSIQVDEEVFSRYSGAMCRSGAGGQTAASDPGPELHHSRAGRKTKNDKINATIIHTWDEQTRYY